MGPYQSAKTPGGSVQQISRQVQITVTDALRALDTVKAIDPASQAEVESLRGVVLSDLSGLEAEFGREEGPRADRLERFFSHLLSSGDHIGQIEALAGALLGGAPPPSQPLPDSPVAGLHRLHSALSSIRRQWQEIAPGVVSQPASPLEPQPGALDGALNTFLDEITLETAERHEEPLARGQRASTTRPPAPPARKSSAPERYLDDLGLGSPSGPASLPQVDTPRPRALITFVSVFVLLALLGVGGMYLGLNSGQPTYAGPEPTVNSTIALGGFPTQPPQPTSTLNPAPPQLTVLGNPVFLPCPGQGANSFILENTGGQTLTWSATVNPVGSTSRPVTLDSSNGSLYGSTQTSAVSVTVTAQVGNIDGTITIKTNISGPSGTAQIAYHVHGC